MKQQPINRMPKNPDLPILFAKTVLGELADIRATLRALSDVAVSDYATRRRISQSTAHRMFHERKDSLAKTRLDYHLHELGLDE
jgi:hypothetical protein